jgi:hypothetical protein
VRIRSCGNHRRLELGHSCQRQFRELREIDKSELP